MDWEREQLLRENAALRKENIALSIQLQIERGVTAQLREVVARLELRVRELEMRVAQTSRTSHRPPSSDPPWNKGADAAAGRPGAGKKKRGGQRGHKGHQRSLLAVEQVDQVVEHVPARCEGCGADLRGQGCVGAPRRHQVWELPEVQAQVTEHQRFAKACKACGHRTMGKIPALVGQCCFGPRVHAAVGLLTGGYRLSRRHAASVLAQMCGIPMSVAAVSACEGRLTDALSGPWELAHDWVVRREKVHADETGFWLNHQRAHLWTVSSAQVRVLAIRSKRSAKVAQELLDGFEGLLTTDRYSGYYFYPMAKRQVCWAHLQREVAALAQQRADRLARKVAQKLHRYIQQMFRRWGRVRDGTLPKHHYPRTWMAPVQARIQTLLHQGSQSSSVLLAKLCRSMLRYQPALWTFVRLEAEPTNNLAEQSLRHGVIWRKTSFGAQSDRGARFVERILSAVQSLRAQNRNVFDYLSSLMTAFLHNQSLPTFLPIA